MVENLDKETFKTKIHDYETNNSEWKFLGDKPAVIDFYADWCGPCKMVAPVMEELSDDYSGKIDFYKLDVDANPELAQMFQIQSIPSILFIPNDGHPQLAVGAAPKVEMQKAISDILGIDDDKPKIEVVSK